MRNVLNCEIGQVYVCLFRLNSRTTGWILKIVAVSDRFVIGEWHKVGGVKLWGEGASESIVLLMSVRKLDIWRMNKMRVSCKNKKQHSIECGMY
jgi:hypothetical protein